MNTCSCASMEIECNVVFLYPVTCTMHKNLLKEIIAVTYLVALVT